MSQVIELMHARPSDAAPIALMSRDLIEEGLGWSWRADRILRHIKSEDNIVVVARRGEQLVGFAIMRFGENVAHLLLLAVASKCQRAGVGRELLDWLEVCARNASIAKIMLEVRSLNHGARRFYRKMGYREAATLRGYYRRFNRVEHAVRMIYTLPRVRDEEAAEETLRRLLEAGRSS